MYRIAASTRRHALLATSLSRSTPRIMASTALRWNSSNAQPSKQDIEAERKKALKASLEARDELQRDWDAREISYDELKPKTVSPAPDAYLIDVREPDEVAQGIIPSAVNLPLTGLAESLRLKPDQFRAKFGFDLPEKEQEVTFYCRSGKRSSTASDIAKRAGYKNILNYKGSWLEWASKEGKP